jgi:uncharacterized protein (DUF1015 family)
MDYNRVVKDLNGLSEQDFLRAVYNDFEVEKIGAAFSPTHLHEFGMYLGGTWFQVNQ